MLPGVRIPEYFVKLYNLIILDKLQCQKETFGSKARFGVHFEKKCHFKGRYRPFVAFVLYAAKHFFHTIAIGIVRCADLYIRHCLYKLYLQDSQIRQAGECTCVQFCYIICTKISKTYKLILRWVFWRQKLPTLREHLSSPLIRFYFQLFVGGSCLITFVVFVYA
jgi:hypothetical protein